MLACAPAAAASAGAAVVLALIQGWAVAALAVAAAAAAAAPTACWARVAVLATAAEPEPAWAVEPLGTKGCLGGRLGNKRCPWAMSRASVRGPCAAQHGTAGTCCSIGCSLVMVCKADTGGSEPPPNPTVFWGGVRVWAMFSDAAPKPGLISMFSRVKLKTKKSVWANGFFGRLFSPICAIDNLGLGGKWVFQEYSEASTRKNA